MEITFQISGLNSTWILRESDRCDRRIAQAGLANLTDVVVTYDDTSERITVRCTEGAALELRGDMARMFGFLNNTLIRASDKKGFTLALPETENQYFYVYTDIIKSQYHGDVVVPVLRTVTVKGEHGSYVSKNFERPLCSSEQKDL